MGEIKVSREGRVTVDWRASDRRQKKADDLQKRLNRQRPPGRKNKK